MKSWQFCDNICSKIEIKQIGANLVGGVRSEYLEFRKAGRRLGRGRPESFLVKNTFGRPGIR
jgi:hypothetical protein